MVVKLENIYPLTEFNGKLGRIVHIITSKFAIKINWKAFRFKKRVFTYLVFREPVSKSPFPPFE